MDFQRLCPGPNAQMLGYVFRSIIGQFSMQSMAGQPLAVSVGQCADALRTSLRQLLRMIDDMGQAPIVAQPSLAGAA